MNIIEKNRQYVQSLAESEGALQAPININEDEATLLELPPLVWTNWLSTGHLKMTNTGHTAMLTGHWKGGRPSLTGGHLTSQYTLGQIHFHWGPTNDCGSEHTMNSVRFPLEMHVLLIKDAYQKPDTATRERDGMIILVYMFELRDQSNIHIQPIIEALGKIRGPYKSTTLPHTAVKIVVPFNSDYFLYWGSILTDNCAHSVAWFVCQQSFGVSGSQVAEFRKLFSSEKKPIFRNYCDQQPAHGRSIFLATTKRVDNISNPKSADINLSTSTFTVQAQRRCCISARRRRLRKKHSQQSLEEISINLNEVRKETKRILKELETITKDSPDKGRNDQEKWKVEFEMRLKNLEMATALMNPWYNNAWNMTPQQFARWGFKSILFRDVMPRNTEKIEPSYENDVIELLSPVSKQCSLEMENQPKELMTENFVRKSNNEDFDKRSNIPEITRSSCGSILCVDNQTLGKDIIKKSSVNSDRNKSKYDTFIIFQETKETTNSVNFIKRNRELAGKYKRPARGHVTESNKSNSTLFTNRNNCASNRQADCLLEHNMFKKRFSSLWAGGDASGTSESQENGPPISP